MTICSVITSSYYKYAKTLLKSISRYNKDFEYFLLIIDYRLSGKVDSRFQVVTLDEVISDEKILSQMLFRYTAFEMSCSLKPYLMSYVLDKLKRDKVIYFDTDIYVLNNLSVVDRYFAKGDILITPHSNLPEPDDGKTPQDYNFVSSGIYNAGFIGVSRTANGLAFLNWWRKHLQDKCLRETTVDQPWLPLAVVYFNRVYTITHPGFNVAYWNLHERNVEYDSVLKKYSCNSEDLLFMHFSGLDLNNPDSISNSYHTRRYYLDRLPVLKSIVEQYITDIDESCLNGEFNYEYTYDFFPSGRLINTNMRRFYHDNIGKYNSYLPFTKEFEKRFLKDYKKGVLHRKIRRFLSLLYRFFSLRFFRFNAF